MHECCLFGCFIAVRWWKSAWVVQTQWLIWEKCQSFYRNRSISWIFLTSQQSRKYAYFPNGFMSTLKYINIIDSHTFNYSIPQVEFTSIHSGIINHYISSSKYLWTGLWKIRNKLRPHCSVEDVERSKTIICPNQNVWRVGDYYQRYGSLHHEQSTSVRLNQEYCLRRWLSGDDDGGNIILSWVYATLTHTQSTLYRASSSIPWAKPTTFSKHYD